MEGIIIYKREIISSLDLLFHQIIENIKERHSISFRTGDIFSQV